MPCYTTETDSISLKGGDNYNYHKDPSEYATSFHSEQCQFIEGAEPLLLLLYY